MTTPLANDQPPAAELDILFEDPATAVNTHLSSKATSQNYLRFADEVKQYIPAGSVLDWGSGRGQMSWLLHRRGLDITSYDVDDKRDPRFILPDVSFVRANHPTELPWPEASFTGLLSCGVLEHVPDDQAALAEIFRVLQPGGCLFIYQLPQVYAYTEFINRMRGLWYHDRRYTLGRTRQMLQQAGFRVLVARRHNFFPKNLTGLPVRARQMYNRHEARFTAVEQHLVKIPVVNWLCHSLELVAQKPQP
ncbi:MAG: class I SAM-dependent methyltransferase [Chloroflexi bacterium]|nr:class I SAM-dependent methyltransferase [Chloroflexota bacterium]